MADQPRRRAYFTLELEADDPQSIPGMIEDIGNLMADHEMRDEILVVTGGAHSSVRATYAVRPDQTRETYEAELEQWHAAMTAAEEPPKENDASPDGEPAA